MGKTSAPKNWNRKCEGHEKGSFYIDLQCNFVGKSGVGALFIICHFNYDGGMIWKWTAEAHIRSSDHWNKCEVYSPVMRHNQRRIQAPNPWNCCTLRTESCCWCSDAKYWKNSSLWSSLRGHLQQSLGASPPPPVSNTLNNLRNWGEYF